MSQCNSTAPVLVQSCECKWRWSKWSKCTVECDGGNTTRVPMCFCNNQLTDDSKCDPSYNFGTEVVPCNEYECGEVPALNKLYWITVDVNNWPIPDFVFNCTQGNDPADSPMGQTYYQVLSDPNPASHLHPEWYYLAKEWITAELNFANGVNFPPEGIQVINTVKNLLQNCAGWPADQIPMIYSLKEKLGRLNNNIGGLQNVDSQLAMMNGNNGNDSNADTSRLTFILAIVVPLVAVLIVAVALGLTIYYVREKTAVANDKFESEDEEEPLHTNTGTEGNKQDNAVPLEMDTLPTARDESSSEER